MFSNMLIPYGKVIFCKVSVSFRSYMFSNFTKLGTKYERVEGFRLLSELYVL